MRIVIALGGNALLRRGEPTDAEVQRNNIAIATRSIAALAVDHEIVVTHGNGPQIGLLALQAAAYEGVRPYPLDILAAESQGQIGYMLERELASLLPRRRLAALLTQVAVSPHDPAFQAADKPIGPVLDERNAGRMKAQYGWTMGREGDRFRRLVPSPEPRRVLELESIEALLSAGSIVICAGGGGIPVVVDDSGTIDGVEAVIDKDASACLLATTLRADRLLLLTDVPAVYRDWPEPRQQPIQHAWATELDAECFAPGSMRPKIRAAIRFAMQTGRPAGIGAIEEAMAVLMGQSGTTIAVRSS